MCSYLIADLPILTYKEQAAIAQTVTFVKFIKLVFTKPTYHVLQNSNLSSITYIICLQSSGKRLEYKVSS